MNNWSFLSIIVDWIWPTWKNLMNFWAWGPTWPWLNPIVDPEGLTQPQKWVQLGFIFLDFSLNPKLDTFFGQANTNLDPEGSSQPNFEPRGHCRHVAHFHYDCIFSISYWHSLDFRYILNYYYLHTDFFWKRNWILLKKATLLVKTVKS